MPVEFKKAERKQAWLKLAVTGPSGSGKTYSALAIASGMGSRIAVIDTENHSASLYADRFAFDTVELDPPYTVEKYFDGIKAAVSGGYEVLIIDSISHAWAGEGGLLEQKSLLDERGGGSGGDKKNKNQFSNWNTITKQHEAFKAKLLAADIHLICTMRSKQDYVLGEGNKPIKVGMAPIQREGMEYEFASVLDIAMNHTAQASKDRTGIFRDRIFTPCAELGVELMAWLKTGKEPEYRIPMGSLKGKTLSEVHPADLAKSVVSAQEWASKQKTVPPDVTEFIRRAQIEIATEMGTGDGKQNVSESGRGDGTPNDSPNGGTPDAGHGPGDQGAGSQPSS